MGPSVEWIKSHVSSGHTYLRTVEDGSRVPTKIYYVTHDGRVQVHTGPGTVDRHGFPLSVFEPVVCLDPPEKCLDAWCGQPRDNCRLSDLYCVDCYHDRF